MKRFDIRGSVFPAAEENPYPFVSKGPHGSVMFLSSREKLLIVIACPLRLLDRVACPFMECLAQKTRISLPAAGRSHVAALFDYGSHTSVGLNLTCVREAIALRAQGGDQSGNQSIPSAWQRVEDSKVRMGFCELLDPFFAALDIPLEILDQPHSGLHHENAGMNDGLVQGGWHRLPDLLNSALLVATIMLR